MIVLKGWAINGTNCITKGRKILFYVFKQLTECTWPTYISFSYKWIVHEIEDTGNSKGNIFLRLNATFEMNLVLMNQQIKRYDVEM